VGVERSDGGRRFAGLRPKSGVLTFDDRALDRLLANGTVFGVCNVALQIFGAVCAACHGNDGEGKRAGSAGDMKSYEFPPLWGKDSFNDGAGMARLIAATTFEHIGH
jgi:hypothetical protein